MKHISTYIEYKRTTRRVSRWRLALAAGCGLLIGVTVGIFYF